RGIMQVQIFSGPGAVTMVRFYTLVAVIFVPGVVALGFGPGDNVLGAGAYGAAGGAVLGVDPCDRGTIFNALKVVRAYRDNEAFAFKHFEGKQLDISGRLVAVKRDKIVV